MKCAVHNDIDAIGTCVGCGKFICDTCKTDYKNKFYCKACLASLLEETEQKSAREKDKWEERAWSNKGQQPGNTNIVVNNTSSSSSSASASAGIGGTGGTVVDATISSHSKMSVLLLAVFLGWAGVHRFMVGKIGTGILYLCTFGVWGLGWIYDILKIVTNSFKDAQGKFVQK